MIASRQFDFARGQFAARFALCIYLGALIFPTIHALSEGSGEHCHDCEKRQVAGPVLISDCGGDCGDPTHHHHQDGHDHSQCAICHAPRAIEAPTSLTIAIVLSLQPVGLVQSSPITCSSTFAPRVHPIRGPPSIPHLS